MNEFKKKPSSLMIEYFKKHFVDDLIKYNKITKNNQQEVKIKKTVSNKYRRVKHI